MTDSVDPVPEVGGPLPLPSGRPAPSKGVALTNWLVHRATGLLEKRASRRGFLIGSAMAGSAVAIAGCTPLVRPGAPYTHITDCANSLCNDGYTEFCCSITNGINLCPSDSFAGGWWRADYSSFCNGTRYYIDCMQFCCGDPIGYQNFCAGCQECSCANGCNTRRVYCNYFRYGQCHPETPASGPIACRVVTCVPPYTVAEWACTTTAAVDNATAEHAGNCPPPPPPPPPPIAALLPSSGGAVQTDAGEVLVFVRGTEGGLWYRRKLAGSWSDWVPLGGSLTSGIGVAASGSTLCVVVRSANHGVWSNHRVNDTWSGWRSVGGAAGSDPSVVALGTDFLTFVRGTDDNTWMSRFNGSSWSGWQSASGAADSEPSAVVDAGGNARFMVRGRSQGRAFSNRLAGTMFDGWVDTHEAVASNPSITADASGVYGFVRAGDGSTHWSILTGSSWGAWQSLGGNASSDPIAFADGTGVHVLVRGLDNGLYHNRRSGGVWTGFTQLGGSCAADPVVTTGPAGTYVFVIGAQGGMWHGILDGDVFSGWVQLGGAIEPIRARP